ncbi:MAG: thiamine pyrophosphokinase, partial [Gemmobacter sp.]|nr:thiamine pyrophosphokinase [Gemmobacter sp.]
MKSPIVQSKHGVTLVGGGPVSALGLRRALARAPYLVAVDGGADRALRLGHTPGAVVGDFDSISDQARVLLADRLFPIPEQETTDFDKALRSVAAPFFLAVGFSGARIDHGLAVLNGLVRQPTP